MENKIRISKKFFTPIFWRIKSAKKRFVINYGGTASSKSFSQFQAEILHILNNNNIITLCIRKYGSNLYDSCFSVCKDVIQRWNLAEHFTTIFGNSRREIICNLTGSRITFMGLDDPEKLKSIHGISRIVIEEATQLQLNDILELNRRARGFDNIQIFVLFNPIDSEHWIKKHFFDDENISKDCDFLHSCFKDNPFLTEKDIEQIENLKNFNYNQYRIYALGEWGRADIKKPFAFAFDEKKHLADGLQFNYTLPVCLSFDFNVDPITCLATQYTKKYIHHIKEFRLTDSNVYELCDNINIFFSKKNVYFKVTGDSSGTNRSALAQGNINYYKVIKDKLKLTDGQMILNSFNPSHQNSYVLTNSLFQNYPEELIDRTGCKFLIDDLRYVEIKDDKSFDNKGDKYKGHLLDCLRYFDWSFLRKFINNSYLYKLNQK